MYIPFEKHKQHAERLKAGLAKMPDNFTAILCWWCEGTTMRNYKYCNVCNKNFYDGNGLLWPGSVPASDSVAYQVLNAAMENK